MGFYEGVVPQVFAGKTKTYRIRDHKLKVGDKLDFENSQTKEIFGKGQIVKIERKKVSEIDLKDPKHGKTYDKVEELIAAFKKHNPSYDITKDTKAFIYTYKFTSKKQKAAPKKEVKNESKTTEKASK